MTDFAAAMPNMLRHAGEWEGVYTHVARDGTVLDRHRTWTLCEFPTDGDYAYVQSNRLTWDDGRVVERSFGGVFRDGLLHWDTDRSSAPAGKRARAWSCCGSTARTSPGCISSRRSRCPRTGGPAPAPGNGSKGVPTRRTLCDEDRVA